MKTFVIFPTICFFVLTLTLLRVGLIRPRSAFLWSTIMTIILGGLMTWLSVEIFFLLYYANFLGVLVLIPCLTYLTNKLFKDNSDRIKWIRILGLGLLSTVLTIATAGFLILISFIQNPMDPPTNKQPTEIKR